MNPPRPRPPDASVHICHTGRLWSWRINLRPFQVFKKVSHYRKSAFMLEVIRMIATGLLIASKSRRKKALSGITILATNDRKPTADSSSRREIIALFSSSFAVFLALASFAGGSLLCIRMLSNSIPRNSAI